MNNKPPRNTKWIMGNDDLPQNYAQASFDVVNTKQEHSNVTVSKRMRQVLEVLMISPVYCASPIRLGHYIDVLRDDHCQSQSNNGPYRGVKLGQLL